MSCGHERDKIKTQFNPLYDPTYFCTGCRQYVTLTKQGFKTKKEMEAMKLEPLKGSK